MRRTTAGSSISAITRGGPLHFEHTRGDISVPGMLHGRVIRAPRATFSKPPGSSAPTSKTPRKPNSAVLEKFFVHQE